MKSTSQRSVINMPASLALSALLAGGLAVSTLPFAHAVDSRPEMTVATVTIGGEFIDIESHISFDQGVLRISGPGGYGLTAGLPSEALNFTADLVVDAEPAISSPRQDNPAGIEAKKRLSLLDGTYHYEIKFYSGGKLVGTTNGTFKVTGGLAEQPHSSGPAANADESVSRLDAPGLIERTFGSVLDFFVSPAAAQSGEFDDFVSIKNVTGTGITRLNLNTTDSIVINQDSWRLANDADSKRFEISEGGANTRLAIIQGGNVGLGTTAPQDPLHIDRSGGFQLRLSAGTSHARFDMFGTSLRIGTHNHSNVFRIFDDSPTNSLVVQGGNVGVGTSAPALPLHVLRTDGSAGVLVQETNGTPAARELFKLSNNGSPFFIFENTDIGQSYSFAMGATGHFLLSHQQTAGVQMRLTPDGNMTIAGSLAEGSSRAIKDGITPIDPATLLAKLDALPVSEWSYQDVPGSRHVGPMAEDFHAVFGFGPDDRHIAPRDLAGVALAAAKALKADNDAKNQRIMALESRMARLEALLAD